jgi:hypothetical protein
LNAHGEVRSVSGGKVPAPQGRKGKGFSGWHSYLTTRKIVLLTIFRMPRSLEIAASAAQSDKLLAEIESFDGIIGLRVQKNSSLKPKGDVISLVVLNKSYASLMQLLNRLELLDNPEVSLTSSQPLSVISSTASPRIQTDGSESSWEEMQSQMNKDSHTTLNGLLIMFLAGVVAVFGITSNSLHIVVGAMVVAPGFEPLTRLALGLATASPDWKNGLLDTLKSYATLLAGAFAAAMVMDLLGKRVLTGDSSYLPSGSLVSYWTTIDTTSVLIAVTAAFIGALVIVANRAVLTAGVMIALALVPSAAITSMAVVAGDMETAGKALTRLFMEVSIVLGCSLVVLLWKKLAVHKRNMAG